MTNGGEAVSLYHQRGVLVLHIADVYKLAYVTENSTQAHNPKYINNDDFYTQCYTVSVFNCRDKMCKYTDFRCI